MTTDLPTTLAAVAAGAVAILAGAMAFLTARSYRATGNARLLFVILAFGVFVLKSVFTAFAVVAHVPPHDVIEFVVAMFDLVIVGLLFTPFVMRG